MPDASARARDGSSAPHAVFLALPHMLPLVLPLVPEADAQAVFLALPHIPPTSPLSYSQLWAAAKEVALMRAELLTASTSLPLNLAAPPCPWFWWGWMGCWPRGSGGSGSTLNPG